MYRKKVKRKDYKVQNSVFNRKKMMINSHNHSDYSENMKKCQDYIHALEEERTKIQVFQRELPLCLDLVTQAIETCKQQLSGTTTAECNSHGKSECSHEQTSTDVPVLEEFMPIKRADSAHNSDHGEEVQDQSEEIKNENSARYNKDGKIGNDKNSKKSDWLKSVQLWNQTPDPPSKQESPRKSAVVEVKKNGSGGAFHPFKKEKSAGGGGAQPASTSSTAETGGNSGGAKKEEKEGQSERKARRCWSPELHRRFLQALQQLGGAHVGTPKQIRELMKVDGLTNDEVKSHLQKYRLHTRRPSTSSTSNHNNNTQTPQFVVVGGIWMQPEYARMATNTTLVEESGGGAASKKIYAPVAAPPPPPFREAKQKPSSSHSDDIGGGARSYSPAASASSTHTTTASLSH